MRSTDDLLDEVDYLLEGLLGSFLVVGLVVGLVHEGMTSIGPHSEGNKLL